MTYYRAVAHADAVPATPERIGVLLVNLGTPDSPSYFAVQRYLREFFGDRRVINTSRLIWLPLLYGVILPFRPIRGRARKYRKIWMPERFASGGVFQAAGEESRRACCRRISAIGCASNSA